MKSDTSTESDTEQRMLKLFKPACYGLAAICFSLTLQTLFADADKVGWPFYVLILLIIPLVVIGTLSAILSENPKSRPKAASLTATLCYTFIIASATAIGFCLEQLAGKLGIIFGAGLFLALAIIKIVEYGITKDKEEEAQDDSNNVEL